MTLKQTYERFLSSPNPLSLSETASLHYVTTLTSYTQQGPIIRHLETQNKKNVQKKTEKTISAVEGHSSIALEVETTLEFIANGGAYLPGLDNLIVDRVVTLPITHVVNFDKNDKINQIRLSWDQGSLLKQVEVIGSRARNWPIFDGKDQIRLISSSSDSAVVAAPAAPASRGRSDDYNEVAERNPSPSKKYIKDPHASLDVFDPPSGDERHGRPSTADSSSIAPREAARPPPREYSELFAAGHEDHAPLPNGSPNKAHSENVVAPKGAGARRFQSSRLFEEDQDFKEPKIYKTNPARYNHFDIGDHDDNDAMQYRPQSKKEQKELPMVARRGNQGSQWDFDDFATPAKATQRQRAQDEVHFSLGDEGVRKDAPAKPNQVTSGRQKTEAHFEFMDDGTPRQRLPNNPKARKDAEVHFEFRDEATPAPRRIIARTKAAEGIYADPLHLNDEESDGEQPPLSNITNNAGRRKNFDSQWDAPDDVPNDAEKTKKPISQSKSKAVQSMGSQWDNYDQSPEVAKKLIAGPKVRNGTQSSWGFDDEEEAQKPVRNNNRRNQQSNWDF